MLVFHTASLTLTATLPHQCYYIPRWQVRKVRLREVTLASSGWKPGWFQGNELLKSNARWMDRLRAGAAHRPPLQGRSPSPASSEGYWPCGPQFHVTIPRERSLSTNTPEMMPSINNGEGTTEVCPESCFFPLVNPLPNLGKRGLFRATFKFNNIITQNITKITAT